MLLRKRAVGSFLLCFVLFLVPALFLLGVQTTLNPVLWVVDRTLSRRPPQPDVAPTVHVVLFKFKDSATPFQIKDVSGPATEHLYWLTCARSRRGCLLWEGSASTRIPALRTSSRLPEGVTFPLKIFRCVDSVYNSTLLTLDQGRHEPRLYRAVRVQRRSQLLR